ncbi:hypothetical protein EV360DRAFT_66167 [Lentinula raphanica]|nr:hypothetical protein EV360DRAFT_66167 [Lentinula raphanica]
MYIDTVLLFYFRLGVFEYQYSKFRFNFNFILSFNLFIFLRYDYERVLVPLYLDVVIFIFHIIIITISFYHQLCFINICYSEGQEIGAIVGGVIGGLVVLTLLSVIFTVLRRKRRNAKKRPRGSVYLGNMDQSQLDTFLKQKPRANVDSLHSSSSMPLLSLPQMDTTLPHDIATEYTDVPASSLNIDAPDAAEGNDQNGNADESETGHSLFLPSPYSQHGHDGNGDDVPPEMPQSRLITPSPRPESQFYAPIPVQAGDYSIKALESSASGSRPSTPFSLSMIHDQTGVETASPSLNAGNAEHSGDH